MRIFGSEEQISMVKAMLEEAFGPAAILAPTNLEGKMLLGDPTTARFHMWINACAGGNLFRPFDFDAFRGARSPEHVNLIGDLLIAMLVGADEIDRWIQRYEVVVFRHRRVPPPCPNPSTDGDVAVDAQDRTR